jgi:hypothetical protein
MKNIVYYNELSSSIKKAIKDFFSERAPDIISFPFKGKHMKGFFFIWDNINYLIIKAEVVRNGNTTLELDFTETEPAI